MAKNTSLILDVTISSDRDVEAIKAFLSALKIKFEVVSSPYDKDFVNKIKESEAQYERGEYSVIKTEDLWK